MNYYKKYSSNTCAGSGNQTFFTMKKDEIRTGRVFYKIYTAGEYNYSLMFSNTIDSTYEDGSVSRCNLMCPEYIIHSARIGKCKTIPTAVSLEEMILSDNTEDDFAHIQVINLRPLTFDGKISKNVASGELFFSDPIKVAFEKDEYLCLEITFSGDKIPCHEESLLPVYIKEGNSWKYSKEMPLAGMIGCDRSVKGKIVYLGDSITQGIGTENNSYLHWTALLSEKIGSDYSHWNLGIGYGRASDAASDGVWLDKAKNGDIIFVCYGVNDIMQDRSEQDIKKDLLFIATTLKKLGKTVIFQTVPPFNYSGDRIKIWENVNNFILTELKSQVDFVFDAAALLGEDDQPYNAKFGGHPDKEGCRLWADTLFAQLQKLQVK